MAENLDEIYKWVPDVVSPSTDTAKTQIETESLKKHMLEKTKICARCPDKTGAEIFQEHKTENTETSELSSVLAIDILQLREEFLGNKLQEDLMVERDKEDWVHEIMQWEKTMSEPLTQVKPSDSNANLNAETDLPLHVDSGKKLNSGYTGSKDNFEPEVYDASIQTPARKLRSAKFDHKAELPRTSEEKSITQKLEEHFATMGKEFKPVTNNRSACTSSSVSFSELRKAAKELNVKVFFFHAGDGSCTTKKKPGGSKLLGKIAERGQETKSLFEMVPQLQSKVYQEKVLMSANVPVPSGKHYSKPDLNPPVHTFARDENVFPQKTVLSLPVSSSASVTTPQVITSEVGPTIPQEPKPPDLTYSEELKQDLQPKLLSKHDGQRFHPYQNLQDTLPNLKEFE